jgi:hypothetical protein
MKIKELIEELSALDEDAEFLVACDEELNTMFSKFEIGDLGDNRFVIYGLSGCEVEDDTRS